MDEKFILTIDQGTTSTRVIVFDHAAKVRAVAQQEFTQHYPRSGWVEHDAEEIWECVQRLAAQALGELGAAGSSIAAVAITNQRETAVIWDRATGRPIHRAIVWQDTRTAELCAQHKDAEPMVQQRTGLVVHPYFSGTKVHWLLNNVAGARQQAAAGRLAFGTIDSFLIWRLTAGQSHVSDVSNASRTMLFNIHELQWDSELCRMLDVPMSLLPRVQPSSSHFGDTRGLGFLPDGIPITGVAGDQQASLFGQACHESGQAKCTYGTGAFMLVHTGATPVASRARLVTTLAATMDDTPLYAVEGSIFVAGAVVQWLRDGLGIIDASHRVETLADRADADSELIFVPALVGMGAPHWNAQAKGTVFGITRATTAADLAKAALDGIVFQVADLSDAVFKDFPEGIQTLRVDGGAAANNWLMQRQADVLGLRLERMDQAESTALGATFLAGLGAGFWSSLDELHHLVQTERIFEPALEAPARQQLLERWRRAVATVTQHYV